MLLDRFIDHVKKQHRTAIGINFLIVILGVFIGVHVNRWRTSQPDAQRERAYLSAPETNLPRNTPLTSARNGPANAGP